MRLPIGSADWVLPALDGHLVLFISRWPWLDHPAPALYGELMNTRLYKYPTDSVVDPGLTAPHIAFPRTNNFINGDKCHYAYTSVFHTRRWIPC